MTTQKFKYRLTKTEAKFLKQKYQMQGMSESEAFEKVSEIIDFLNNFTKKLNKKNLPEETKQEKFFKEFEKLCNR